MEKEKRSLWFVSSDRTTSPVGRSSCAVDKRHCHFRVLYAYVLSCPYVHAPLRRPQHVSRSPSRSHTSRRQGGFLMPTALSFPSLGNLSVFRVKSPSRCRDRSKSPRLLVTEHKQSLIRTLIPLPDITFPEFYVATNPQVSSTWSFQPTETSSMGSTSFLAPSRASTIPSSR